MVTHPRAEADLAVWSESALRPPFFFLFTTPYRNRHTLFTHTWYRPPGVLGPRDYVEDNVRAGGLF